MWCRPAHVPGRAVRADVAAGTGVFVQIDASGALNLLSSLNGVSSGASATVGGFPVAGFASDSASGNSFGPASLFGVGVAPDDSLGPAIAQYSAAVNATPVPQSRADAKQEQADIVGALSLVDQSRLDEARDSLNDVLSRNRNSAGAYGALGEVALRAKNYAQAEQYFRRADSIDATIGYSNRADDARTLQSDDDTVLHRAAQLLKTSDTRDDGVRLLAALTDRSPSNVDARINLAEGLLSSGNAAGSLVQYQLAITGATQPQLAQIETRLNYLSDKARKIVYLHQLIAEAQLGQGKNSEAQATLNAAATLTDDPDTLASLKPDQARAIAGLGREALKNGDVTSALDLLQRAAGLDGGSKDVQAALGEAYVTRGELRARLGNPTAAVEDFRLAARYVGDDDALRTRAATGAYSVGAALKRRRATEGGSAGKEVVALQAAYDIDPSNLTYRHALADSRNTLGDEFLADGKFNDAAHAYQRAYNLVRSNATYKANTISAFQQYGDERVNHNDFAAAISAYLSAYKIDTRNAGSAAKVGAGYAARGADYRSENKFDKARSDYLNALKYDPNNQTYRDALAALGG